MSEIQFLQICFVAELNFFHWQKVEGGSADNSVFTWMRVVVLGLTKDY